MVDERVRGRWKGKREERRVPSPAHTHPAPLDKRSHLRTGPYSSGTVWGSSLWRKDAYSMLVKAQWIEDHTGVMGPGLVYFKVPTALEIPWCITRTICNFKASQARFLAAHRYSSDGGMCSLTPHCPPITRHSVGSSRFSQRHVSLSVKDFSSPSHLFLEGTALPNLKSCCIP